MTGWLDLIKSALDLGTGVAAVATKALPPDEVKWERVKVNHPWLAARAERRAEKERKKQLKIKLEQLYVLSEYVKKHGNIEPTVISSYLFGDTSKAEIIRQIQKQ